MCGPGLGACTEMGSPDDDLAARGRSIFDQLRGTQQGAEPEAAQPEAPLSSDAELEDPTDQVPDGVEPPIPPGSVGGGGDVAAPPEAPEDPTGLTTPPPDAVPDVVPLEASAPAPQDERPGRARRGAAGTMLRREERPGWTKLRSQVWGTAEPARAGPRPTIGRCGPRAGRGRLPSAMTARLNSRWWRGCHRIGRRPAPQPPRPPARCRRGAGSPRTGPHGCRRCRGRRRDGAAASALRERHGTGGPEVAVRSRRCGRGPPTGRARVPRGTIGRRRRRQTSRGGRRGVPRGTGGGRRR